VLFSALGLLVGWWQFRSFPWRKKPSTLVYLITMLLYISVCTGIGYLAGGWLAGQFGRIIAAN